MKNFYFFLLLFFFYKGNAQYTVIPDEDFEQELINQGIDSDGIINHLVLNSDINTIISLNINGSNLHNIIGIEGFTQLQSINIRNCINLTSLDFSNNLNLIAIFCNDNSLTSINITNNIALQGLYCVRNQLTTLDVSNNINLSTLACALNLLESLDVSQNVNLTQLFCSNNLLTTLDIYANPALLIVSCGFNPLTHLSITNVPQLYRLHCTNTQLTTLDLSNVPSIKELFCQNNLLTTLDFANNPELKALFCMNNINLSTLNLNSNSFLNILHCNNNSLSSVLLQNGSNTLLNGQYVTNPGSETLIYDARFKATNNPNLSCIFVDDVANCNANWLEKDATSHYVSTQQECEAILQNDEFTATLFTLYPNPVNNLLFVENNTNTTIQKIVVYDIMGKTIMEQSGNIAQIDFSNITSGLYFVKISSEKEIMVKKIMRK
ncbi:MAG: T9SS type A sorting domain-containing protein [Flavobacterium sp.]|jgi:hypothetical protein|uniref:T9SS type A sorting domain-containing protein n=1 Tax=Flavobacterium sp. TaxID=239 RepID=UPI003BA4720D